MLDSEVPVIVDFYADWCRPCKNLSPLLDQLARHKPDVRVVKVNVDDAPRLARKYGVRFSAHRNDLPERNLVAQHVGLPSIRKALIP